MNALRSIAMAFAMFSRIPMPRIEWKKENMRYMLCALPLVGAAIGLALALWVWVCLRLKIGQTLFAAGIALMPLLLSGGIHMDGFCDTADALSSHQPAERKREILKDSHAGAANISTTFAAHAAHASVENIQRRAYHERWIYWTWHYGKANGTEPVAGGV